MQRSYHNPTWREWIIGFGAVLFLSLNWGCAAPVSSWEETWCAAHPCGFADLAFTEVAPAGRGGLTRALTNLNDATGLELQDDPAGIPIRWENEVLVDGVPACGATYIARNSAQEIISVEIVIAYDPLPGCAVDWIVIRHEVACHALTGGADHEMSTGVCGPKSTNRVTMDEPSLELLCDAVGGCPALNSSAL